eukprot:6920370-Alexandrium_andersonii.AAC.1
MSISKISKRLLRLEVERDVSQVLVGHAANCRSIASGVSLNPAGIGLAYRGRLAARRSLAVGADWPLNRADLADQPE